ncbi:MAG: hypothetical protein GXP63_07320 [DPANN group archaeon]|nr:hypothetical protein [DPANN group archaeon]
MPKGRPTYSKIRQNMVELLFFMGKGYGYEIYKAYRELYPPVTMRSIYYHLKKGTSIGEFKVEDVQIEKGEYSWGEMAKKTYYCLGSKAKPGMDRRIKDYFAKRKTS